MQVLKQKKTRYTKHGKILTPISNSEFIEGLTNGYFVADKHRSYAVLLYYTAIRRAEALRCVPEQFTIHKTKIVFDVGKRLKHGIETPPLTIPRNLPFVNELEQANFFSEGWTIAQVHSWTELTLKALDSYIGLVTVDKMGMSLK